MIKPFFGKRFGEWDERELGVVMIAKEREWYKAKLREQIPSDARNAKMVLSLESEPSLTTQTVDTSSKPERFVKNAGAMGNMSPTDLAEFCHRIDEKIHDLMRDLYTLDPSAATRMLAAFNKEKLIG
tara:strand:- start:10866 stop:11246 length:381 start_codon:yes stop_codon:yes gene_type:complete